MRKIHIHLAIIYLMLLVGCVSEQVGTNTEPLDDEPPSDVAIQNQELRMVAAPTIHFSTHDQSMDLVYNSSPNGYWTYGLLEANTISFWPVNHPSEIQSISFPMVDRYPTFDRSNIWSPDSTGFVYYYGGLGCWYNPIGIINIVDGIFQTPEIFEFPDSNCDRYSVAWSPTGDRLYVAESQPRAHQIKIYIFNRHMELQSTVEIPLFSAFADVYPIENGLILIHNEYNYSFSTSEIQSPLITSYIYYYSFQNSALTLIYHDREMGYSFCGISPDSRYLLVYGQDFVVLDRETNQITNRFSLDGIGNWVCVESEDYDSIAFMGSYHQSRSGLIIWYWDNLSYHVWGDEYQLFGWNYEVDGYSVLFESSEGNFQIITMQP